MQPFCDGTHKLNGLTDVRPVRFQVEKTGEYWMCNCKQTSTRPICDRTHKDVSVLYIRPTNRATFHIYTLTVLFYEYFMLLLYFAFQVDRTPKDFNNSRMVMFGDESPVYDGVAHKLGYKPKNGGFQ